VLYHAVKENKGELVKILLENETIDINYPYNDESPLMIAVK
jgi:hypothetical protein